MSDDIDQGVSDPIVPPAPTVIGSLREKRAEARKKLVTDIKVPRTVELLGLDIRVRFSPLSSARLEQAAKSAEKSKSPDRNVAANAAALADACVGVFYVVDGEEKSLDDQDPNGDWPKFDQRLAEILGMDSGPVKAADVVRELYFTDGDITSVAGELTEWSGFTGRGLEEDFAGN